MRVVIIGAPASGKSTLTAGLVRSDPSIRTFGVRRYFARQITLGTPLGKACESLVKANAWIPDQTVVGALHDELRRGLGENFVLEGMPGNRRQAELLDEVLEAEGLPLDTAVHVDTPESVCMARAHHRLVCVSCDGGSHQVSVTSAGRCARCGGPATRRATDEPERFALRLRTHAQFAQDLVAYYRPDRLVELSGAPQPADVLAECRRRLRPTLERIG